MFQLSYLHFVLRVGILFYIPTKLVRIPFQFELLRKLRRSQTHNKWHPKQGRVFTIQAYNHYISKCLKFISTAKLREFIFKDYSYN